MPTIEDNLQTWGHDFDWEGLEPYWSARWGGEAMQWHGTLLPRIHAFLPAGTILEIAPGYGRWSHYLKDYCGKLILVDLVEKCIEKRDPTLPSKVQRLIDYLGGLTRNVTVGEGSKYGTTEQAVADIDRAVGKLRAWYNRSRMHPEQGVSDEDRAELQRILDEVRAVLVEVKVGPN